LVYELPSHPVTLFEVNLAIYRQEEKHKPRKPVRLCEDRVAHEKSDGRRQDWEQGRRSPRGAAKTLLRVAQSHPKVLGQIGDA